MTQTDIEISAEEGEVSDSTISDNESDLEKLRQMAILSMIKTEKMECEESGSIVPTVYEIEKKLRECRTMSKITVDSPKLPFDTHSTFISCQKRSLSEPGIQGVKRPKISEVVKLVENFVGKPVNINDMQYDMSMQPELKNKLFKILKNDRAEIVADPVIVCKYPSPTIIFFNNGDNIPRKENDMSNNIEVCNINEEEKSVKEITKSIDTMTALIREKLQKSRAIIAQIDNLKKHKIQLHKDINATRSKICYLNKVKKQRIVNIAKFKHLRNQCELSPISSLHTEKIDTQSIESFDTDDNPTRVVNCNQIICSSWIHSTCVNRLCGYQHPKIAVSPIVIKRAPIKENDKVFLQEMNSLEFISKFQCAPCSSLVHLSNFHIIDDWHCKSCCQQIMDLNKPIDILAQLLNIWHHIYKRYIMTQNIAFGDRSPNVLNSLLKCTEALQAKLVSTGSTDLELFRTVGKHVLTVFSENYSPERSINFIRAMNYDFNLVIYVTTLVVPVNTVHQLISDVIDYQIDKVSFENIDVLIQKYCEWSYYLELSPLATLFNWLEITVNRNIVNSYFLAIEEFTRSLLNEIIGSNNALAMDFSTRDLQHDEAYWLHRKDNIEHLASLYPYKNETQTNLYLTIHRYRILSLFFTDKEECAIELCEKFAGSHYYFLILLSILSLQFNYPITVDNGCIVTLIEHNYNKSEWLYMNRSENSCINMLEGIANKLYKNTDGNDSLRYYEHFLGLDKSFDIIISNLESTHSEFEKKLIRESSSIWLCYINLSVFHGNIENMAVVLESSCLFELDRDHLCRVVQRIFVHFATLYDSEHYFERLKWAFFQIQKYIQFEHYMDLVRSVSFEKLNHCQLVTWLFLIDFCVENYSDRCKDLFLTKMSSKLLSATGKLTDYVIFSHIVLCYPIKVQKVWLNLIQLILNLNLPLYTLLDACGTAVSYVRYSKPLWRHYYNCAVKIADKQMITDVQTNAAKFGFSFE